MRPIYAAEREAAETRSTRTGAMTRGLQRAAGAVCCVFFAGCGTLGNGRLDADGYGLGRATALAYLAAGPALSAERQLAVRAAWEVLGAVEQVRQQGAAAETGPGAAAETFLREFRRGIRAALDDYG